MVTISAPHHGTWGTTATHGTGAALHFPSVGLHRALYVARGILGALFAAELVLPEADPDRIRPLLVELGHMEATAPQAQRHGALVSFQRSVGLTPHGKADGRTVSALVKAVREQWELRDLGLVPAH